MIFARMEKGELMAEYFAGGHLRFINGEWRDDNGDVVEIARVRHGCWESRHNYPECSECGYMPRFLDDIDDINYCPNCGAKIDLEE